MFGDDVRILRSYPGQWQVHYVPPPPEREGARVQPPVLLACEDGKPTFQRLIELLKKVPGSRWAAGWEMELVHMAAERRSRGRSRGAQQGSRGAQQRAHLGPARPAAHRGMHPRPCPPLLPLPASPSRASKSWLDRFLTTSMGTFNEFAAYSAPDGDQEHAGAGAAPPPPPAAAAAPPEQPLLRDIITGELLPAGRVPGGDTLPAGGAAAAAPPAADPPVPPAPATPPARLPGPPAPGRHPVGVKPPRDIRLEPVNQIARWLGSQPERRAQRGDDGPSSSS